MLSFLKKTKPIKFFLVFFLFFQLFSSVSQNVIISGYVYDVRNGETLIGANIFDSKSKKGAVSNNYGFFSLSLAVENEKASLSITYIGYVSKNKTLTLNKNHKINFSLIAGKELKEVTIVGKEIPIEQRNEMGVVSLPMKQINALPAIGGEPDIMKVLQLMPGVQSGNEGSSALYVRGGSPDQNLVLLDDVPLYYVNHLGGFVSIFNTDAISKIKLTKGGFPAQYGSRLSSVLDVRMKDGNQKEFHGKGMFGMVASKISVEGPIKTDTTSFILSVRRFLYDFITKPLTYIIFDGVSAGYTFYDINAKVNHKFSDKDRLYVSLYSGDDKVSLRIRNKQGNKKNILKQSLEWGNFITAIRWNHLYNQKLFSNLTLSHTRYRYLTKLNYDNKTENLISNQSFKSGIYDANAKIDFDYFLNANYKLKFGANSTFHTFTPGVTSYFQKENNNTNVNTSFGNYRIMAFENAIYLENEFALSKSLSTNFGARLASYHINSKDFVSFEPRILINYEMNNNNMAIKVSYAKMQQNVHLLTSSGAGIPADLWVPATDKIIPAKSQQFAFGVVKTLYNGTYEFSLETYFKQMRNLINYEEGATYLGGSTDWQNKIETGGRGISFGAEILLQKKQGKSTGWLAYTISKTNRKFDNFNFGKVYPHKYDRRHDISVVFNKKLKENIDFSASWVFGTGNTFTLAEAKYNVINDYDNFLPGENYVFHYETEIYLYGKKNSYRMRPYHRLDIGINFHKKKKWGKRTWNISIYNLYNRQNPYYYYFETQIETDSYGDNVEGTKKTVLKQQSLFPIIPSVSYSFSF